MAAVLAATAAAPGQSFSVHKFASGEQVCARRGVRVGGQERAMGELVCVTCAACKCSYSLSPSAFSTVRSSASLLNVRVSGRVSARRSFLGKGLRCVRGTSRGRRHMTRCMYAAAALTEEEVSVSVKPLNGDDDGGPLPPLSSKPVLTMTPPPRKKEVDDTPSLKPAPKPALQLRVKGSPAPQQPASGGTPNGFRPTPRTDVDNTSKRIARQAELDGTNPNSYKVAFRPGDRPPRVASNNTVVTDSGAAVQSLGEILEKVEKLGVSARPEAGRAQTGNVSEGLSNRPASVRQPGAWWPGKPQEKPKPTAGGGNAVISESRPPVSGTPAEASTSSGTNGAATANRPQPPKPEPPTPRAQAKPVLARPKPLLAQPKPVLRPRPPPVDATAVRPRPPTEGGVGAVRKGPVLRDIGAAPKTVRGSVDPAVAAAAAAPPKAFSKAAPTKGKEDWRKKANNASDGAKRRVAARDKESLDVVSADLNIDIPGAPAARRGGRKMNKASRKAIRVEAAKAAAPVRVDILEVGKEGLSCQDLAQKLAINDSEIVKVLFMKGLATTVTQTLDEETVRLVCKEFDVGVVEAGTRKVEDMAKKTTEFLDEEDLDHLLSRPPVVTIMGHVDHGKTSLLDFIRKSKVAAGEAGGITQGIGAYRVLVQVQDQQQACVFLDTPGHQAFSAMRARGARVTDIAVIVVAADDGVRPQSLEAIAHAKAANVPIVIAINKIDKEGANPDRVMQELSAHGLFPEDWGGDVPMVQVSAVTGANVEILLETIMLVAEFQDLKANPDRSAKGTVIEASLDKTRGAISTLLVQNGTLRRGDVVLCGESYGKVRALLDDTGARVDEAGPSTAVQIMGLSTVPVAGDKFEILDTLDEARERAAEKAMIIRNARLSAQAGEGKVTLHSFANAVAAGQETGVEQHQLNLVLKVDAQGTVEAIREALQTLPQDTVSLRFLMQSAGDISASDIDLAVASEAIVVGFNVGLQPGVQAQADNEGVEIRLYRVIYDLVDEIRTAMEGLLGSAEEEVPIGLAEVRAVFGAGSGKVAGCMVTEGKLVKGCGVHVMRGGTVAHVGTIDSLRRVKELAKEVVAGLECGLGIDGYNEWQEGDAVAAFNKVAKRRTLEDASVTVTAAVVANTSRSL